MRTRKSARKTTQAKAIRKRQPTPKSPVARSLEKTHYLVYPELYKWARGIPTDGSRDDDPLKLRPPHTVRDVKELIESKFDWDVLRKLLRENPRLIGHPVIWAQVDYLRGHDSGDPISDALAGDTLYSVTRAWLSGFLPRCKLHVPKRRGRKLDPETEYEHEAVLHEYEASLKYLKEHQWYSSADVARTIKKIWNGKKLNEGLGRAIYSRGGVWRTRKIPFPQHELNDLAQQTINRRRPSVMRTFLAYQLVARVNSLTYNQVRHIVERTRRERDKWG